MQITAEQCSFGPLGLPSKFLPVAFVQLFDLALHVFLIAALETAAMRVIQALGAGIFTGAESVKCSKITPLNLEERALIPRELEDHELVSGRNSG